PYANKINGLRVSEVRRIKAACTTQSVRVSTTDHHTALRLSALEKAGCTTSCTDEGVFGTTAQRPVLPRCLAGLCPRAFGVSGSRLPLTHAGKPSAPQAPTAVDACLCPSVPYERLPCVSACVAQGLASPTPHRGGACLCYASVDRGRRRSAPVTRFTS